MSVCTAEHLRDFLYPILADVEGKSGRNVEMDMAVSDGHLLAMVREAGGKRWRYSILADAQECKAPSTKHNEYVHRLMAAAKAAKGVN